MSFSAASRALSGRVGGAIGPARVAPPRCGTICHRGPPRRDVWNKVPDFNPEEHATRMASAATRRWNGAPRFNAGIHAPIIVAALTGRRNHLDNAQPAFP